VVCPKKEKERDLSSPSKKKKRKIHQIAWKIEEKNGNGGLSISLVAI